MSTGTKTVRLAGSVVDCRCHACAFFQSQEDEYEVVLPFIKEGLQVGDRVVQIMDKRQRVERLRRLVEGGVEAQAAERSGRFEIRTWENAHLMPGRFDQYAMIALLEEIAKKGESHGSGLTRLWANMEWALEDFPGVHDILEYESRVNYVLPNYDMTTVCAYDVTKFSASLVIDILRIPL